MWGNPSPDCPFLHWDKHTIPPRGVDMFACIVMKGTPRLTASSCHKGAIDRMPCKPTSDGDRSVYNHEEKLKVKRQCSKLNNDS